MIFEVARTAPPALASTSAASSARGAFRRRVLLLTGARHPFGSFAAARWASGARSPLSLARGGLDPRCVRRLFTRTAPEATCRSTTSAIETTREHDRRTVRTLRTRREVALAPSSDRRWLRVGRPRFRGAFPAWPTEVSWVRGRRCFRVARPPSRSDRSPPKLCPSPIASDTSCRSLVVTSAGGAVAARRSDERRLRARRRTPRKRAARARAASRDPPRRGSRSAAPEVPSADEYPPVRGLPSLPQAVPSLGRTSMTPLQSPRFVRP